MSDLFLYPREPKKPRSMSIDIETRSGADISATGLYKYAQDPEFKILLFAYQFDDGPVYVLDLSKHHELPGKIADLLCDPEVTKHAYNAAFEWYCLCQAGYETSLAEWRCTMMHAMYCALPAGLAATGEAIGLPQDKKKLMTGKALIRYFCTPQKPTKRSDKRYHDPEDDPEKWALFKEYCKQDVVAEHEILKRLEAYPVPELEEHRWRKDVLRNAYGIRIDRQLVQGALAIDADSTAALTARAKALTGLENPNSLTQLKVWVQERTGRQVDSLTKDSVAQILDAEIPDDVREVLRIRQQLGKTSVKKYTAMLHAVCYDGRVRGLLQFYGAVRTGRFAGRLVQVQNLPRNYLSTLDVARHIVRQGNAQALELFYGNIPDTLSQLIRTAFIPREGCKFIVTDFSAIEARVIAWLAGETWVNEVFATHGKIYEATASQMFGVPVERIVKGSPEYGLRQKGKVATLALGYNGGPSALRAMGALEMGLAEEELPDIVSRWRNANPHIVQLWKDVEFCAVSAVYDGWPRQAHGLTFRVETDPVYGTAFLTIELPSGRKLFYPQPVLLENKFGKNAVHYMSLGENRKWTLTGTYGGKLVENVVQAIARDCLMQAMDVMEDKYDWKIVMHVHDEVVIEAPQDGITIDDANDVMSWPIPWAPGLILKGAGFEGLYYMKD